MLRRLSTQMYWVFLEEKLPEMLEDIPLALRRDVWFQHSRAAANFARQVLEHLTATYNDRWIGRGGMWLGLPCHRTSHKWASSCGATLIA